MVELVGEGLTNQAIADKLFVGIATVKTHLVHIYESSPSAHAPSSPQPLLVARRATSRRDALA